MPTPEWALLLSFWLHMLATVAWLGGLAAVSLFVLPLMRRSLSAVEYASWLQRLNRRLDPIGWISLGLLTTTGLVQMSANPNYEGFLQIGNNWALALFLKHLVFFAMIAVSSYITWGVGPGLQRAALLRAKGLDEGQEQRWALRLQRMITLNLLLGTVVLAFTALARIA